MVVVQEDIQGRGSWDKLRGRKKKPKTLRYSELEERERLAQELAMASIAIVQPKNPVTVIEEPDDDDETILFALISRLEH